MHRWFKHIDIKGYDEVTILSSNTVVVTPNMMSRGLPVPLTKYMARLYEYFNCPQLSPWVMLIYEHVQLLNKYFGVPFGLTKPFGLPPHVIRKKMTNLVG